MLRLNTVWHDMSYDIELNKVLYRSIYNIDSVLHCGAVWIQVILWVRVGRMLRLGLRSAKWWVECDSLDGGCWFMGLGALRRLLGLESAITLREFLDSRVFGSAELCRAGFWDLVWGSRSGWAAFPGLADALAVFFLTVWLGFWPCLGPGS